MTTMILKRKRSDSPEATHHPRKSMRGGVVPVGLKVLPPNAMRIIVEKLSLSDQMVFREVCRYAHDEVESYWRSEKSISVSQLYKWFPSLYDTPWKFSTLSSLLPYLFMVFNLCKSGNLRKISLRGVEFVNVKFLINCAEMATRCQTSIFFQNVGELDIRGCFMPPDDVKMLNQLFPNLHTIILNPNLIALPKCKNVAIAVSRMEITHHVDVNSNVKRSEVKSVPSADAQLVAFIREHLSSIRHIFIDLEYNIVHR